MSGGMGLFELKTHWRLELEPDGRSVWGTDEGVVRLSHAVVIVYAGGQRYCLGCIETALTQRQPGNGRPRNLLEFV